MLNLIPVPTSLNPPKDFWQRGCSRARGMAAVAAASVTLGRQEGEEMDEKGGRKERKERTGKREEDL